MDSPNYLLHSVCIQSEYINHDFPVIYENEVETQNKYNKQCKNIHTVFSSFMSHRLLQYVRAENEGLSGMFLNEG